MTRVETQIDIFLSHSARDSVLAEGVAHRFQEAGLECFDSAKESQIEREYHRLLPATIRSSRSAVFLLSSNSKASQNILFEAGAAFAQNLPMFVLLSDLTSSKDVSEFFGKYRHFKLWDGLPRLIAAVKKLPELQLA